MMKSFLGLAMALAVGVTAAEKPQIDIDFEQALPGRLLNKGELKCAPGVVRTTTPYGRLRQDATIPEGTQLSGPALGRSGVWNALRLGDLPEGARIPALRLDGKPFSLGCWVYLYDRGQDLNGTLFNYDSGYKVGFRMEYSRAHWNRVGQLTLTYGTAESSGSLKFTQFGVKNWHQVVLTYDGTQMSLYVNGALAESKAMNLRLSPEDKRFDGEPERNPGLFLLGGKWWMRGKALDYKIDELTFFDRALTAKEVADAYNAGKAPPNEEPVATLALKTAKYGYLAVNEAVEVEASVPGADTLLANGKIYALPLREPVTLQFATPGLYAIKLEARAGNKVLRRAEFPVAVAAKLPTASRIGVANLTDRQPEAAALGIKLSRIRVDWAQLEPKKQEYDWTWLDSVVRRHREAGAELVIALTGRPGWAGLREGSQNLPADMELYRKLWRLLSGRYDVKYFEVGQEMNRNGQRGTAQQKAADYIELAKVAAEAIRAENPEAKILVGAVTGHDSGYIDAVLNAKLDFDILSIHSDGMVPQLRRDWIKNLCGRAGKPVWNTVCGFRQLARSGVLPDADALNAFPASRHKNGGLFLWPWQCGPEEKVAAWLKQELSEQFAAGVERSILEYGPSLYYPELNYTDGAPGLLGLMLTELETAKP